MSCLSNKRLDKWVAKHYSESQQPQKKNSRNVNNNYLTVTTTMISMGDLYSTSQKTNSYLLPLLFYWKFDFRNSCTLNPQIGIDNFTTTVLAYANKKGLKQKLNGRTVELSVDEMPHIFDMDDKGYMVWVILFYFGKEELSIQPQNKDIVVSYKLMQDGTETKKGKITIPDVSKSIYLKMFQSTRKKTWQFLEQHDANITAASRLVIDKLIEL